MKTVQRNQRRLKNTLPNFQIFNIESVKFYKETYQKQTKITPATCGSI